MVVVAVLVPPQVMGFEAMIPGQVFGMANQAAAEEGLARPPYEVRLCTPGRPVTTQPRWGVVEIASPYSYEDAVSADIVVVPGADSFLAEVDEKMTTVLQAASAAGNRVAAVCVGAFAVAAAGLLDGQRATTHWQWATDLAQRYPKVEVDASVLFVDAGAVLTSAGVTSGIDLCLHLVRSCSGADLAAKTARRLVLPAWRHGGQAQYIEHVDPAGHGGALQATVEWMEKNLTRDLDLDLIAGQASMSVRTLSRQFRAQVGTTPQALLTRMRVDRVRSLLETTDLSVDRIAAEVGFGSVESLRHHFRRLVGVAPRQYRENFVGMTPPAGERGAAGTTVGRW